MRRSHRERDGGSAREAALRHRLTNVEPKLANLADTAAQGGAVPVILDALARHEHERQQLPLELGALERSAPRLDRPDVLKAQLRGFLGEWDGLLSANVSEARPLLDLVLAARISFQYVASEHGRGHYELTVPIAFDRVLTTAVPELRGLQDRADKMASPRGCA
jgi:hypothetical protein